MDINTACTSFMYALSTATAMIRTGVVRNAVVIGVELISQFMDWSNRGVAVLFGDGAAAVVLEATERKEGLIGEKLGCSADVRDILRVRGMGTTYSHHGVMLGDTSWNFDGQEIFKRAVMAMAQASQRCSRRPATPSARSTSSFRTRRTCGSSSRWRSASARRWSAST
jgi:3-oxoacyl-[acyl-carrier-protein] synthase-3